MSAACPSPQYRRRTPAPAQSTAPPVPRSRHKKPGQTRNASGQARQPPPRARCSKPLDLRDLLGNDTADVLRLGHHAIRLKEAVVAATVANRGNVNVRVL